MKTKQTKWTPLALVDPMYRKQEELFRKALAERDDLWKILVKRGGAVMIAFTLLTSGCASFHVVQTDETPDERIIRTDIRATAWFTSAQSVAKLKALQTDKTQSFGSDSLGQQGATNAVEALKAVAHILELIRPTP